MGRLPPPPRDHSMTRASFMSAARGRECGALARSACELVHTAGGGIGAIGADMREHVLLFCLLGLVLAATIILVTAPEDLGAVPRRMS